MRSRRQAGGFPSTILWNWRSMPRGLGYYVAGSRKFGEAGDFVTRTGGLAPCLPSASHTRRQSCWVSCHRAIFWSLVQAPAFWACGFLLAETWNGWRQLPNRYLILELSPELQQRQRQILRERVPQLLERVSWLSQMPSRFEGFVLANELLDAMPASRFRHSEAGIEEGFVVWQEEGFRDHFARPETVGFSEQVKRRLAGLPVGSGGYVSELNLRLGPWFAALGGAFERGAVLLIDYGYPRSEYYHPQRSEGTLMCHYRHRAHADPYRWPGLQDITAQVDFTAVAEAAEQAGFALAGYNYSGPFSHGKWSGRAARRIRSRRYCCPHGAGSGRDKTDTAVGDGRAVQGDRFYQADEEPNARVRPTRSARSSVAEPRQLLHLLPGAVDGAG